MKYGIRDREAGNVIENNIETYKEAERILKRYEDSDKKDGIYEEDFYEIFEVEPTGIYANGDRAIMVEDGEIIAAAGLTNVLCCEPDGLIETEELEETSRTDFEWKEADINGIRKIFNLSIKQISDRFDIPYRTVQNWVGGQRECPAYILKMMMEILTR